MQQAVNQERRRFFVGDWLVEPDLNRVSNGPQSEKLEPMAMALLVFLSENQGQVVTRQQLHDEVWQQEFVSDSTVSSVVTVLRRVFSDDARNPRFIETIPKSGYRLIAEVVDADAASTVTPFPGLSPEPTRSPYPGLTAFTEQDAEAFFGRDTEVEALWRKIEQRNLLAVIGPSGVGKSSFLRAGVIPAAPDGWGTVVLEPGASPFLSLARTLAPVLTNGVDGVQHLVGSDDPEVALAVTSRWRGQSQHALLVVDQFEELFTLTPPDQQARFVRFVSLLVTAADVHVVLAMRDDFLYECHAHAGLAPVFEDLTPLATPSENELCRALIEPAQLRGYVFDDDTLAHTMVAEVACERAALPLLAFAVSRMWELRDRDRRRITRAAYERIGGVEGALAQHAEDTIAAIGAVNQGVVREMFRNLVTAQGTRASRDRAELLSVFGPDQRTAASKVLDGLIDARLLTSFECTVAGLGDEAGQRIEVVHESLLTSWPRLVRWQAQETDAAHLRDQLRQAAALWDDRGQSADLLWSGASERELAAWLERYPGRLTTTEQVFVDGVMAHAGRRRRRQRALVATSIIVLLAVALSLGILWRSSARAARKAEAHRLHQMGQVNLDNGLPAALADATASLEFTDTPAVRRLAVEALSSLSMPLVVYVPTATESYVTSIDVSPNYQWLALGFYDASARLWNASGHAVAPWQTAENPSSIPNPTRVEFMPDSTTLLSAAPFDRFYRFWTVPGHQAIRSQPFAEMTIPPTLGPVVVGTARRLMRIQEGPGSGGSHWSIDDRALAKLSALGFGPGVAADVSPDGRRLIFAADHEIRVADLIDGNFSAPRMVANGAPHIEQLVLHPKGYILATADADGTVSVWRLDGDSARVVREWTSGSTRRCWDLCFSASGRLLAASYNAGPALVWDLEGPPDADPMVVGGFGEPFIELKFDAREQWLATAGLLGAALWPIDVDRRSYLLHGHSSGVTAVVFGPDGSWLASASADGTVRWWPLRPSAGARHRVLFDWGHPIEGQFLRLAADPGGRYVAVSAGADGVRVVPVNGDPPRELEGFSGPVHALAVGPTGRLVAVGGGVYSPKDTVIRVWDLETGDVTVLDAGDNENISEIRFAPDGDLLAASGRKLRRWKVDTREHTVIGESGWFVLSNDGTQALSLGSGWGVSEPGRPSGLVLHDLVDGSTRTLSTHGPGHTGMAFDPSGTIVVTTTPWGAIQVGPVDGSPPHLLIGHTPSNLFLSVAVSPDGKWIASGSGHDEAIRLWPMPDVSEPPLHTLPLEELINHLKAVTNLRTVPTDRERTSYRREASPFPGWASDTDGARKPS